MKDDKNKRKLLLKKQKEEERKFGIFYDDDYDYIQHVKDREMPEYDWSEMDQFLLDAPKEIKSSDKKASKENDFKSNSKETIKVLKIVVVIFLSVLVLFPQGSLTCIFVHDYIVNYNFFRNQHKLNQMICQAVCLELRAKRKRLVY